MSVGATPKIKTLRKNSRDITITARSKDTRHMNAGQRSLVLRDLKDTITIVISMDTRDMNVDPK